MAPQWVGTADEYLSEILQNIPIVVPLKVAWPHMP